MPFGTRRPFEYVGKGRRVVHPENYDTCPVCGRQLVLAADGLIPVVPCMVPITERDDYELLVIFGCSGCYKAQKRFNFATIEELQDRQRGQRITRVEPASVEKIPKRAVGRPKKKPEPIQQGKDDFLYSLYLDIRERLIALGYDLGSTGKNNDESKNGSYIVESNMARGVMCQGLPDDDIEFGMTEEQKQRMNQAVHDASERTKLVPTDAWNGKTAGEVLGLDANGVPNGW